MNKVFDVVLLLALPASGKSETRNFMSHMDPLVLEKEFHIGQTLQLDDFPYVYLIGLIRKELDKIDPNLLPNANLSYGMLIKLLNEDYNSLINNDKTKPDSYALKMFERFDRASAECGACCNLMSLDQEKLEILKTALEEECKQQFLERLSFYPEDGNCQGKTIMIEFSRGGADGSSMPLQDPYGYQYALRLLSNELLSKASILYLWVTPEESRRKNFDRDDPNDPGSILNHGVPLEVMLSEYGCDDMLYLKEISEIKDTITIKRDGQTFHMPIGIFDNRIDKTTPFRSKPNFWKQEDIQEISKAIKQATDTMYQFYK